MVLFFSSRADWFNRANFGVLLVFRVVLAMSDITLGTRSRGMVYGQRKQAGTGCYIPNAHVCPRCKNKRTSQAHKIRCYRNVYAVWG